MASAPSETSIANGALTLLGERRINSLDDKVKAAGILKDRFAEVRDEVLRSHSWNFATKRASLAADSEAPVWGYDHQYTLPNDCLRILQVGNQNSYEYQRGSSEQYRVEGRKIVTNIDAPLLLEYTRSVTDPMEMDVMFRQVFSAALAKDIAEALTGSAEKVDDMERLFQMKLRSAKATDGQEPSPRRIESSEFLNAREESWLGRDIPTGSGTPL